MKYKVTVENIDYTTIAFRNLTEVINQGSFIVFVKDYNKQTGIVYSPRRGDRIYIELEGEDSGSGGQ